MASSVLLLLVAMTACVAVQAVTERASLESWNYVYYARNWAHVGSVTALNLVQVHPASPMPDCRENATFGFYGATTWVDGGCRGDFDVDIDDTDTMEQKFNQLITDVNDGEAKQVNMTLQIDAQSKLIAELGCLVAWANKDDPVHGCCCPAGWTEHQPDGVRICYRQAEHHKQKHNNTEAQGFCQALHPRSTLVMPKTAAQLAIFWGYFKGEDDYDHVGMDIDESGNFTWHDGEEVDLSVVKPKNTNDYPPLPCSEIHHVNWSVYYKEFNCRVNEFPASAVDGLQQCQIILNADCDETEQKCCHEDLED